MINLAISAVFATICQSRSLQDMQSTLTAFFDSVVLNGRTFRVVWLSVVESEADMGSFRRAAARKMCGRSWLSRSQHNEHSNCGLSAERSNQLLSAAQRMCLTEIPPHIILKNHISS